MGNRGMGGVLGFMEKGGRGEGKRIMRALMRGGF
jgi:hypothetical protein